MDVSYHESVVATSALEDLLMPVRYKLHLLIYQSGRLATERDSVQVFPDIDTLLNALVAFAAMQSSVRMDERVRPLHEASTLIGLPGLVEEGYGADTVVVISELIPYEHGCFEELRDQVLRELREWVSSGEESDSPFVGSSAATMSPQDILREVEGRTELGNGFVRNWEALMETTWETPDVPSART
jgi:hypothetical protein